MGQDSKMRMRLLHGAALAATGWLLLATSSVPGPNRDCFDDLGDEVTLRVTLGARQEESNVGGAGGATIPLGSTTLAGSTNLSESGDNAGATGNAGGDAGATGNAGGDAGATGSAGGTSHAGLGDVAGGAGVVAAAGTSNHSTNGYQLGSCNAVDTLAPGKVLDFDLDSGWGAAESADRCIGYSTKSVQTIPGLNLDERVNTGLDIRAAFTALSGQFTLPTDAACRGRWSLVLRPNALREGALNAPLEAGGEEVWLLERRLDIEQAQFCGVFAASRGRMACTDTYLIERIEDLTP